jgi:glycosyltransferase involved in cell wall biosynthesis
MRLAIIGTVGVPARYGGFETLAENLVRFHAENGGDDSLTVYCSRSAYTEAPPTYLSACLRYSRLKANGVSSIPYDVASLAHAVLRRHDVLLVLGVSGAIALPFVRMFSHARIVTNVDGVEWRRAKWTGLARSFLRWSEHLAVRFSHAVIADNKGIADYLRDTYGIKAEIIAYGGDHAVRSSHAAGHSQDTARSADKPYALALCRIEPENNVDMILQAFERASEPLVFVGNWESSTYGRALRERYSHCRNIRLLDPVYDSQRLYSIRAGAAAYIHGHSAGGTNPALVEMMHFGIPVYAFDCSFNRYTTENRAQYFTSCEELERLIDRQRDAADEMIGSTLRAIATRDYVWDKVSGSYFALMRRVAGT